jgi:hypothetical protein
VVFTVFFAFFPAGLVLYWFVNNLLAITAAVAHQQGGRARRLGARDRRQRRCVRPIPIPSPRLPRPPGAAASRSSGCPGRRPSRWPRRSPADAAPRQASLRLLRDAQGEALDRALVIVFPAPQSFTGENVVEFQLHGSPVLVALLMRSLVALGAREAGPGEFTRRAYMNGRLDLAQAEAVADLIASASAQAARAAMRSLEGEFSAQLGALAEALIALRVRLEAGMDFPEEGVDDYSDPELAGLLAGLAAHLDALRRAARPRGACCATA